MRQVAGEPQELQLEGERERIERGPSGPLASRRPPVEKVEESRQSAERARIRLLLREEAEHCFEPEEPDVQPIRILARRVV